MLKCQRCGRTSDDGILWKVEQCDESKIVKYVVCGQCLERMINLLNLLFLKKEEN